MNPTLKSLISKHCNSAEGRLHFFPTLKLCQVLFIVSYFL